MSILLELKTYFDKDDGFLPEIAFEGYRASEVASIYKNLYKLSDPSSLDSALWHIPSKSDMKLNQFLCAVKVMQNGDAEPFHMLFVKPTYEGIVLPNLGAYISSNEIILDYRRGVEWSEDKINILMKLINNVMRTRSDIVVKHQECEELLNLNLEKVV